MISCVGMRMSVCCPALFSIESSVLKFTDRIAESARVQERKNKNAHIHTDPIQHNKPVKIKNDDDDNSNYETLLFVYGRLERKSCVSSSSSSSSDQTDIM